MLVGGNEYKGEENKTGVYCASVVAWEQCDDAVVIVMCVMCVG